MRINLAQVLSNPFRDFDLYPIDEEQVQKLKQSIEELGFFSGVTARKVNNGMYELAAGHHRVEAAERAGKAVIEAVVEDYSDQEMVRIMCMENATQRGASQASVNDSVAATARIITRDVLLGEGPVSSKILEDSNHPGTLAKVQATVAADGPGMPLIYRMINGFGKEDRRENKEQEILTSTQIDHALQSLKSSGYMGKLVSEVYDNVQDIRKRRDAAAKAKQDAEEQARQAAVAKAEADAERERFRAEQQEKARKEAEEWAKATRAKAEENAKARAEAEAAAKAAAEAKRQAELAAQAAKEAERKANAERMDAAAKARDIENAAKKEAARRAEEAAAVDALKSAPTDYDTKCDQVFGSAVQAVAFRQGVLSPMGKNFLAVNRQLEFAKHVKAELVELARVGGHGDPNGMGSIAVKNLVNDQLMVIARAQSEADKAEAAKAAERQSNKKRVEGYWTDLKHATSKLHGAMLNISEANKEWPYKDEPFPIDIGAVAMCNQLANSINKLARDMGLHHDYAQHDDSPAEDKLRISGRR